MSESSEEMKLTAEASRIPDHSLLFWDVQLNGVAVKRRLKVVLVVRERGEWFLKITWKTR